jgi:hypothetical protein
MVGYKIGYQSSVSIKTTLILPLANATYQATVQHCNWHNPQQSRSAAQVIGRIMRARNGPLSQNCNMFPKQESGRRNFFPKGPSRLFLCKVGLPQLGLRPRASATGSRRDGTSQRPSLLSPTTNQSPGSALLQFLPMIRHS